MAQNDTQPQGTSLPLFLLAFMGLAGLISPIIPLKSLRPETKDPSREKVRKVNQELQARLWEDPYDVLYSEAGLNQQAEERS